MFSSFRLFSSLLTIFFIFVNWSMLWNNISARISITRAWQVQNLWWKATWRASRESTLVSRRTRRRRRRSPTPTSSLKRKRQEYTRRELKAENGTLWMWVVCKHWNKFIWNIDMIVLAVAPFPPLSALFYLPQYFTPPAFPEECWRQVSCGKWRVGVVLGHCNQKQKQI